MSKQTGGPAFPRARSADPGEYHKPETYHAQEGMDLRDYFAAKAMQGICADPSIAPPSASMIASLAYEVADAMIAERYN